MLLRALLVAGLALAVPVCREGVRQPPLGRGPQRFGPETLSVGQVFGGSFSADGRQFYFFRKTGAGEDYRIHRTARRGSGWSDPEPVTLGGAHSDLYPAVTRSGRLIFSSYRPLPGTTARAPRAQLWYADSRPDGTWAPAVFLAEASTPDHYHSWVTVDRDDTVYFRRTSPDWSHSETRHTRWNGRAYGSSTVYDPVERWKGWRSDVRVVGGVPGPDGQVVFLDVATRHPTTGGPAADIWVSRKRGDTWSLPTPLGGQVNSDGYDVFPSVSPDGRHLYFVRDFKAFYTIPLAEALRVTSRGTDADPQGPHPRPAVRSGPGSTRHLHSVAWDTIVASATPWPNPPDPEPAPPRRNAWATADCRRARPTGAADSIRGRRSPPTWVAISARCSAGRRRPTCPSGG